LLEGRAVNHAAPLDRIQVMVWDKLKAVKLTGLPIDDKR